MNYEAFIPPDKQVKPKEQRKGNERKSQTDVLEQQSRMQ